ncbi:hypothetical protein CB0940_05180 [Cercospora beticola]|uniref:Uncharacterized protein n=1 Tax=Cercospora beticola TaxID=122368 RepID=A0A2G5HMJ1_CERBT|nr:hypothetical protein CB0940_05180 [Cercospora beticola]PIA93764.1 hypothetical protein CB0940_05180 [Cercospora beticola]WPB02492.1 hypothetical protein RHO25_007128 [Cercospora beticola]
MYQLKLFSLIGSLALVNAAPTILKRNDRTDPLLLTFCENGCGVDGVSNQVTYPFSNEGSAFPGDCVPTGYYNRQSVEIVQDSEQSYTVELFSGEGCNNPILTVTEDGCYTQPEGQIVLSARASLK